jgi:hypothetical protein
MTYIRNSIVFLLTMSLVLFQGGFVVFAAADSPWTQTDWSGGVGTSTTNQYSATSNGNASTVGQIELASNGEEFSNTGFESDLSAWSAAGGSWDLVGGNEFIDGVDSADLTFGDGSTDRAFSLSMWVNLRNVPLFNYFFSKVDEYQFFFFSNNYLTFRLYDGSASDRIVLNSTGPIAATYLNTWTHFVATYDGEGSSSGMAIYIDGVLLPTNTADVGSYDAMQDLANNVTLGVGNAGYQSTYLADAIVFDKELSAGEVAAVYNGGDPRDETIESLAGNLAGYWRSYDSTNVVGGVIDKSGNGNNFTMTNMSDDDIIFEYPGSSDGISTVRETVTTYDSSSGSVEVTTAAAPFNFTQSLNVGDTNQYNLTAYAYTDGSAVTSSDVELVVDGSTISTTYTDMGSGWYQLSGTTAGAATTVAYGAQVKASKIVYLDDFSLSRFATSGTLTSAIFDAELPAQWGTTTFTVSGTGNTTVVVRSDNSSDMSGAPAFGTCNAIISGSDISSNNCVDDDDQYLQYQVQLGATNTATSPLFEDISTTFITDAVAPTLSNINTSNIGKDTATIRWATNEIASSQIEYGTTSNYGTTTAETDTSPRVTNHTVVLTDLNNCTTYHYRVRSTDDADNTGISINQTFDTTGCADAGGYSYVAAPVVRTQPTTQTITTPTTSTSTSLLRNRLTRKGDRGSHVQQLQTALNSHFDTTLDVDGIFGPLTEAVVKLFQTTKNLDVDGVVGPMTLEKF